MDIHNRFDTRIERDRACTLIEPIIYRLMFNKLIIYCRDLFSRVNLFNPVAIKLSSDRCNNRYIACNNL